MALKNNWQNGDTFTPTAANDMANAVNDKLSVNGSDVENFDIDPTPLQASDVGTYSRDEVDDAIDAATTFVNARSVAGNFVPSVETTESSAGTKTLTVKSAAVQVITGTLTHTVVLPLTDITVGSQYRVVNKSTATVTVKAANNSTIGTLYGGNNRVFVASVDAPASAGDWYDGLSAFTTGSPSTLVARDANINVYARSYFPGFSTTATATGTTTMSVASNPVQEFTGSTTQTVKLPSTSLYAGAQYAIFNNSTGALTVQSSGGNTIVILAAGTVGTFTALVNTPTTAANWEYNYSASAVASGKSLTVNNSLAFSGTDSTTMTFPSTSATIARTDAANTFTGVQTMSTPLAVDSGGTGAATLTGLVKGTGTTAMVAATAGTDYVAPGGALGTPSSGTLTNCTFPTLNQNTTGSAASLSATLSIATGGTGQTTAAAAITALTGTQTAGRYLRSDGTNATLAAIVAGDVPTLNQSTTGSAATLTTSRNFQTNLASTTAAGFTGAADNTHGVTGTLEVGNGGTGATTLTGLVKGTGTTPMVVATAGTDYVVPGGALGTPSSATLTNATGLPLAGLTSGSYASAATASVLAQRDSNANLLGNAFVPAATVTSATGTTTLTAASTEIQIFSGTSQTCVLPTTGVVAGQRFTVLNTFTTLSVTSSAGGAFTTIPINQSSTFVALQATPTAAAHWAQIYSASFNFRTTATANSVAVHDANAHLFAANYFASTTSTATAAGTTTLTIAATQVQVFTGSTTQTVKLPTTSVTAGTEYRIINNSSGSVTVQSSAANTIATVTANTLQLFIAQIDTPTTAAHWRAI